MTLNLFGQARQGQTWREDLCPGAVVLRGFAVPDAPAVLFGGSHRADTPCRVPLAHSDVVVWGDPRIPPIAVAPLYMRA